MTKKQESESEVSSSAQLDESTAAAENTAASVTDSLADGSTKAVAGRVSAQELSATDEIAFPFPTNQEAGQVVTVILANAMTLRSKPMLLAKGIWVLGGFGISKADGLGGPFNGAAGYAQPASEAQAIAAIEEEMAPHGFGASLQANVSKIDWSKIDFAKILAMLQAIAAIFRNQG